MPAAAAVAIVSFHPVLQRAVLVQPPCGILSSFPAAELIAVSAGLLRVDPFDDLHLPFAQLAPASHLVRDRFEKAPFPFAERFRVLVDTAFDPVLERGFVIGHDSLLLFVLALLFFTAVF